MARNIPESAPPDPLFIVFCRICGIKDMAADEGAVAHEALAGILKGQAASEKVYAVHSSVTGGFLCVLTARTAMDTAAAILAKAAEQGLGLAVGVTQGRVRRVHDIGLDNRIGDPINLAARLAGMEAAEGAVVVTDRAWSQVCAAIARYGSRFEGPMPGKVKRTKFVYYRFLHDAPEAGNGQPGDDSDPEPVHALVYDIVRFSEMARAKAKDSFDHLQKMVQDILHRNRFLSDMEKGLLWYAPAGDGGVLAFSSRVGGDTALDVAAKLAESCRAEGLEIRLGVAMGPALVLDGDRPVGQGIDRADALCSLPPTGHISVDRTFWSDREEADTRKWVVQDHEGDAKHEKDADALLVFPEEFRGHVPTVSPGEQLEDLLPHIVGYLRNLPVTHHELHLQIVTGLRAAKVKRVPPDVKDLVAMVEAAGINGVLAAMRHWLREPDLPEGLDCQGVRGVVAHLLILGIADRTWLAKSQAALGSGKLPVHAATNRLAAGILVAGVLDVAVRLVGGEPENLVPTNSSVGSASDVPTERFRKLKEYLAAKWGSESDVLEVLEADLEASEPWFVLLDADDGLANLVLDSSQKGGLEGFLLVLQRKEDQPELIRKARALQRHVEELFRLLDELDGTSPSRSIAR